MISNTLIDVYPYSMDHRKVEFLVFKRSEKVIYSGQWRMIGGKVKDRESRACAALRELREETGCLPREMWAVPGLNHYYDLSKDIIHHIAAFAVRLNRRDHIVLNHEHASYKWISKEDAKKMIKWPEQVRLIHMIHGILSEGAILPEWRVETIE